MKKIMILSVLVLSTACGTIDDESSSSSLTKEDVKKLKKADAQQVDYCKVYNWLGDGVCDEFCKTPDPDCDTLPLCGDGTSLTCKRAEPQCEAGQIAEVVKGCYGDCVDEKTCKPTVAAVCGDGSQLSCKRAMPICADGQIPEIVNGCYGVCVDAQTCEPAFCGGIANIQCVVGDCVDNPNDACDPANGGADCGGICQIPFQGTCGTRGGVLCPQGQFCEFPIANLCGATDLGGACTVPPAACTKQYAPVCGCDGVTYGNACMAQSASMSVSHLGKCVCGDGTQLMCKQKEPLCPTGQIAEIVNGCYGECVDSNTCKPVVCGDGSQLACKRLEPVCPKGQIAEIVNGCYGECVDASTCKPVVCGDGSQLMCKRMEPVCPKGQIAEIVNGCYGECVDAETCDPVVVGACGGRSGIMCPQGQFCEYDIPAACGSFDAPGECVTPPQVCTKQYAPVCGCDGITYGNACMAQASSASVVHIGKCDCGDGSVLSCRRKEPVCGQGQVAEIVNGCYGVCVDKNSCKPAFCGGIAGITCVVGKCLDLPNDGCDPLNGGADCSGYCSL